MLAKRTGRQIRKLWGGVDPANIVRSWRQQLPSALTVVESAQTTAAASAGPYLDHLLSAYGLEDGGAAAVRPQAFAGHASDGRALDSLLFQPALSALTALKADAPPRRAMAAGAFTAELIVRTQVADAGRAADFAALAARVQLAGYVRVLSLPSCSRCVVLAGRFYEWNAGFDRHPACDCTHLPAISPEASEPLLTQPRAYFESLSREEQDKVFTEAGAEAIRLGADPAQVVNARRGAHGLTPAGARITKAEARALRGGSDRGRLRPVQVYGQDVFVTTEGSTTRGLAGRRLGARETGVKARGQRYRRAQVPRLMPESILQAADGDRDEAIRLLRRFGYLT